jgi:hypothetical protein
VIVELELLLIVAVVALKAAEVAAAVTVSDAGIVRAGLVFVSVTLAPPLGAPCVRVTVQVLDPFGPRLVGLQASADTTGATRLMTAVCELLPSVAVTIAL